MEEKKQFGRRHQRRRRRSWPLLLLPVVLVLCLAAAYWISGYTFPQEPAVEYPLQKIPVTVTGAPQDGEPAAEPESAAMPWYLTLVNRWNPLPKTYEITLAEIPGGEKVDERIYEPLMEMLEAAKEDNWDQLPMVVSGYRTSEKQKSLYNDKIREYQKQGYSVEEAAEMAKEWVAAPGYSEHQLGFAVDINGATYDLYFWLQENSYKYGFIFRYPGSKTDITGTAEEVWHYRYVGKEAAAEIYEQQICLEEYLERIKE